mgnify:CR=1 FL=1
MSYLFLSPAKINLDLKILGRREDGYHLIRSEMVAINLFDELEIDLSSENLLHSAEPIPFDFTTSIFAKVYNQVKRKIPNLPCFQIKIKKSIPIGAGLGGGSSNAATFIFAIRHLLNCDWTDKEMIEIAKGVGADVPFFFSYGRALVEGIGTEITLFPPQRRKFFTLLFDAASIATPEVYRHVDPNQLDPNAKNQLEKFAEIAYPTYAQTLKGWKNLFGGVTMTGSGSSAFIEGIHPFEHYGLEGFHCHTIDRSPNEWYKRSFDTNTI